MSPEITRLTRTDRPTRTSGTVLSEVRRPSRERLAAKAALVEPVAIDPASLKKDELAALASSRGKSTAGTKADIAKRLTDETTDG